MQKGTPRGGTIIADWEGHALNNDEPEHNQAPTTESFSSKLPDQSEFKGRRLLIGLSVTQIAIGLICIIFNIILITYLRNGWSDIGYGIWGGVMFIVSGSIGMHTVKTLRTANMIKAAKASSIVSAAVGLAVFGLAIYGTVIFRSGLRLHTDECRPTSKMWSSKFSEYEQDYWDNFCNTYKTWYQLEVALQSCIAVLSLVNGPLAFWSYVIVTKRLGTGVTSCSFIRKTYSYDDSSEMVFKEKQVLLLSKAHIVVGLFCIVCNSVTLGCEHYSDWVDTSHGIWGGAVFIVTGAIGLFAVKRKTKCMITALKSSSVVSVVTSLVVIGLAIMTTTDDDYSYMDNTQVVLHMFIAIFSALSGLLALCCCNICLQALKQSFGSQGMLYYGYQVPYNGTSQLVFTPLLQKQEEAVKPPEGASCMNTGIGFSLSSCNPQSALMNPVEPPPYATPHTRALDVASGNPPAIVEQSLTAVNIPEEPNKY